MQVDNVRGMLVPLKGAQAWRSGSAHAQLNTPIPTNRVTKMRRVRVRLADLLLAALMLNTPLLGQELPTAAPEEVGMSSERLDRLTVALQEDGALLVSDPVSTHLRRFRTRRSRCRERAVATSRSPPTGRSRSVIS